MTSSSKLIKDSINVTVLSALARGIGFIVPITIAALFGASGSTDAFYLANTVPTFLISVFVVAIGASLVPYLVEKWVNQPDVIDVVLGNIFLFLGIISAIVIILLLIGLPISKSVLSARMQEMDVSLFINLSILLLPMITLSMLVGITSAVLNARKHYTFPALAPGIRALFILAVTLLLNRWIGIYAVVLGFLIGELVTFLFLFFILLNNGIRPVFDQRDLKSIFEILSSTIPLLLAMIASQFNTVIARIMAAPLGEGSLSVLDYADKVVIIPTTLISTGVMVVLLTHWSTLVAEGQKSEMKRSIQKAITLILFISTPLALLLFILRLPLIMLLFERGAFDQTDTALTASVMGIIALGITPNLVGLIFTRVHLAFQKTKVLLGVSIVKLLITFIIIRLLTPVFGISGIAITIVSTYLVTVPLLWLFSIPQVGNVFDAFTVSQIIKIMMANVLMFFIGTTLSNWIHSNAFVVTLIVPLVSLFTYLGIAKLLNIQEINLIQGYTQRIFKQIKRAD